MVPGVIVWRHPVSVVVSWKDAVTPSDSQGMAGALDPTGAICGSYDEGVGTRICVDPWLLQLGDEKKKKMRRAPIYCSWT